MFIDTHTGESSRYFWKYLLSYFTTLLCLQAPTWLLYYGVASIGRLLKIIGLFCKRAL